MLGGLFTPALEDFYQALKISIEACGGEFHEFVAQLHCCLARVYECYTEHSMSSWEVMRDRRVARLGGIGGQMGEDLPLNNYTQPHRAPTVFGTVTSYSISGCNKIT